MRKRIVLGTACAHASAVLCLGIALLTGGAFAQKRELPLESAVSETPAGTDTIGKKSIAYVPIWKRITIGTYNGVNHIRIAFDDARMRIGNSADEILGRPAFPFSKTEAQLDLVVLTAADLGFQEGYTSLAEIYRRAIELGLNLCPADNDDRVCASIWRRHIWVHDWNPCRYILPPLQAASMQACMDMSPGR